MILMIFWIIRQRHSTSRDRIIFWSIGMVLDIVFGGKKHRSIAFRSPSSGWAGQLPTINKTFRFWHSNFLSCSQTDSSNKSLFIRIFLVPLATSKMFKDFWSILALSLFLLQTLLTFYHGHFRQLAGYPHLQHKRYEKTLWKEVDTAVIF